MITCDDNITSVSHFSSLWGAVVNIFIMVEMRHAHINRETCQLYSQQRRDNTIQANSEMIAISGVWVDKTKYSHILRKLIEKKKEWGKNAKKEKETLITHSTVGRTW